MEDDPAQYPIRPTLRVRREVLAAADWLCVQCGSHRDMQVDHILPIALGGRANPSNLQALCGDCNRQKRAKLLGHLMPQPILPDLARLPTGPTVVVSLRMSESERARLLEWGDTPRAAVLALLALAESGALDVSRATV